MLEHGGNLNDAVIRFRRARHEWLDLSTGINPQPYPVPELPTDAWHRLPETSAELVKAACEYYGAQKMLPVAGSQAAIQALPRLRAPGRVVVAAPAYAEHAHRWAVAGHTVSEVDYEKLADELDRCEVMVVCNPNNPTGKCIAPELLVSWAEQLSTRGAWLVVDEAFADTTPDTSVVRWADRPGLIVLRSTGKFFGLAGLRLGFVAAHESLLESLADALGPWAVSGPAQQIGLAALSDKVWQRHMRTHLLTSGQRLHQLLERYGIQGEGCALYQWWPEVQAVAFHEHMAIQGIWVRLFTRGAKGIRLGLPLHEVDWQRLEEGLRTWNSEGKA